MSKRRVWGETRARSRLIWAIAACVVLSAVAVEAPTSGIATPKDSSGAGGGSSSGLQPASETLHNWAGYLGNATIYPTLYTNKTFLPPLVAMTGSIQNPPGTCPVSGYTDCAWPNNVVTVNTSAGSTSAASWYWNEGSPDWNFQLSLAAASLGESQYYETSCPEQNNTCYAPYAILLSTALQDLGATITGLPSGFTTNFVSGAEGLNMTQGTVANPSGSESSGATVAAVSGALDMAAIACAVMVPPPADAACLVFPLADAIYDAYYLLTSSGPTNVISNQFNPVNNGVLRQVEQTDNGNPLNASSGQYCVPPASWKYPYPNPCEPTSAQRNSSIGQNMFSQSLQLSTLTKDLTQAQAQTLFAEVTGGTVSLWAQNYVKAWEYCITGCFSSYSFYSNLYNPSANASISYPFAPASSISGTVLSGVGSNTPVGGATVYISQSCGPITSPVTTLFTETAGAAGTKAVGTWHFFADPLCSYNYWATDSGPFGSVNSAVLTLTNPPAGGQVNTTGLALDNYGVKIGTNDPYGDLWSATLQDSSGSQTLSTSTTNSLTFYVPNGTSYTYDVYPPLGYVSSSYSGPVTVSGKAQTISVTFTEVAAIDGVATGGSVSSSVVNVTLTTAHSEDLIIVFVANSATFGAGCTDQNSLSWSTRASLAWAEPHPSMFEEYAKAASPLKSDKITCTTYTNQNNAMIAFGLAGVSWSTPFDPSTSLPVTSDGVNSEPSVTTKTTNALDVILGAFANMGVVSNGYPYNLTFLTWTSASSTQTPSLSVGWEVVSAAGTYHDDWVQPDSYDWSMIGDAIEG